MRELPDNQTTAVLMRPAGSALGLSVAPNELVMVDHEGHGYAPDLVPLALRRARPVHADLH